MTPLRRDVVHKLLQLDRSLADLDIGVVDPENLLSHLLGKATYHFVIYGTEDVAPLDEVEIETCRPETRILPSRIAFPAAHLDFDVRSVEAAKAIGSKIDSDLDANQNGAFGRRLGGDNSQINAHGMTFL